MKTRALPMLMVGIMLSGLWLISSCNKRTNNVVDPPAPINVDSFGESQTLEVVTWNIENFPKTSDPNDAIDGVVGVILGLDADVYGVQEITSASAFQDVIDRLNAADSLNSYDGRLNTPNACTGRQLTGVIFKSNLVSIISAGPILQDGCDIFAGRPPFEAYLRATHNRQTFDFYLIVVHLKAFDGVSERARRTEAIRRIHNYVEDRTAGGGDPDVIVVGDWNDELDDPDSLNVFSAFLNDGADFSFLTEQFAGSSTEYSYIGGSFRSLIDHILISSSISGTYPAVSTAILKPDLTFSSYPSVVSDHRPVGAKIPAF